MKHFTQNIAMIIFVAVISACGKKFLDLKPEKKQRIPSTIEDFQAITDYSEYSMNSGSSHNLGVIGSDEYNISDFRYETFPILSTDGPLSYQKKAYTWEPDIYTGGESNDWRSGYGRILRTNIVLDGLSKIVPLNSEQQSWNNAKGCALFHRALNYYNLTQLYCKTYEVANADKDLGLPLRTNADVTENVQRSSLKDTYHLIKTDLETAKNLLPDVAITIFRPGKVAVNALLAKVYLQMRDYELARQNAEECLVINDRLLDFNTLNFELRYTFKAYGLDNPEILFMNQMNNTIIFNTAAPYFNADTTLFESYAGNDLRKKAYWTVNKDGRILFKGSYGGSSNFFSGLATDEVYLIRAECNARLGDLTNALKDLNYLLRFRYDKSSYESIATENKQLLLSLIFAERRKELCYRGTRWEDLKRLNKEPAFATTLVRIVIGKRYELEPNDGRYLWPLPLEAIALGGYKQNIR